MTRKDGLWRRRFLALSLRVWVVILVLVLLLAATGHILLVVGAANSLEVDGVEVNIITVTPGTGDVTVTFAIRLLNPTGTAIQVDRITYKVHVEGEFVGEGEKRDFQVRPGTHPLEFAVTFNVHDMPQPVYEAFYASSVTITIVGEVTVPIKLFGTWRAGEVTVPYEHDEEISSGTEPPEDTPPSPVLLAPPVYKPTASATLTWSQSSDQDFARYEVHHSTSPDFTPSDATKVADITDRTATTHTVGNLQHLTTHYFIVRVYDAVGQHADSNLVSVFIP
jgi:LEA14-like dessication related protein